MIVSICFFGENSLNSYQVLLPGHFNLNDGLTEILLEAAQSAVPRKISE